MTKKEIGDLEFVEYVVKAIVENPDKVKANRTVDEMGVLISLEVDASDMGTLIGKEGRTAKALRTLLRVLGSKTNARVNLKILEPEGGKNSQSRQSNETEQKNETETPPEKEGKASETQPIQTEPSEESNQSEKNTTEEENATEIV